MSDHKTQWTGRRFGNIDDKILGQIKDIKEISWPNVVKIYELNGNMIKWQMVEDIEKSARRIAEIYKNSIDELVGNSEYEWHHKPHEIINKFRTGDWNFYGAYLNEKLVSVMSLHIIRGQRAIQWMWGAVDPPFRGKGIWHRNAEYFDLITEKSGAQMGFFFVVTTHKYSQLAVERAGYKPMGLFIGGEFMGGSDNRYYRQNVIYYGKLYGNGKKYLQSCEMMELTEKAEKLVKIVKELWVENA